MGGDVEGDSDQELFPLARRGDLAAMEAIYNRHKGRLYAYFLRMTEDSHGAEDFLAETFERFIRAIPRYRDDSDAGGLLFRIAYRLVQNRRRRPHPIAVVDPTAHRTSGFWARELPRPDRETDVRDLRALLLEAIRALPERERQAVELIELEGMSAIEAGRVLGCRPGGVRRALCRARAKLCDQAKRHGRFSSR